MVTKDSLKENHPSGEKLRLKLPSDKMADYCRRVVNHLEEEKRYLNPDYSLWDLSRETGIPVKMVSKSINKYMKRNFYDLINRMRIEEAKAILREMAATGSKAMIKEVGTRCGFHSRSVFFSRFNEYERMSPKKYMNLYEKPSQQARQGQMNDIKQ